MAALLIFFIGLSAGFLAQRYAFCIFGALVELLTLGSGRRIAGVGAAVLVFALVHVAGYQHAAEHPGLVFFVGGLVQGVGYYLAVGCPLGLLVRIGEGSKMHLVVFAAFLVGGALYAGVLQKPVAAMLPSAAEMPVTLIDLLQQ